MAGVEHRVRFFILNRTWTQDKQSLACRKRGHRMNSQEVWKPMLSVLFLLKVTHSNANIAHGSYRFIV